MIRPIIFAAGLLVFVIQAGIWMASGFRFNGGVLLACIIAIALMLISRTKTKTDHYREMRRGILDARYYWMTNNVYGVVLKQYTGDYERAFQRTVNTLTIRHFINYMSKRIDWDEL